jgi:hypothetical protein
MSDQLKFQVKVLAAGEVRDADGNLVSSEPFEAVTVLTKDELEQLGLPTPEEK